MNTPSLVHAVIELFRQVDVGRQLLLADDVLFRQGSAGNALEGVIVAPGGITGGPDRAFLPRATRDPLPLGRTRRCAAPAGLTVCHNAT